MNSSHILTFSNLLLANRDGCNYAHAADNNQRNFHNVKHLVWVNQNVNSGFRRYALSSNSHIE